MTGLIERFQAGDRRALARLLSHVENMTDLGTEALKAITPATGGAHLIGLTGPPGAGKSTLASALIHAVRAEGRTVAVLAIDPTSPLTGGATLGDRIRMLDVQDDRGVYIRSMASRGQLGGLSVAAFGAATVLDAFGFDLVLIETVGTGQDEVDIAALADTVAVVQTPGQGDAVQVSKAGVLEIADVLVINKSDIPGASDFARDLRQMVRMGEHRDWTPPIVLVTSTTRTGIYDLVSALNEHFAFLEDSGERRRRQAQRRAYHARMIALMRFNHWIRDNHIDIENKTTRDPDSYADEMLQRFARDVISCGQGDGSARES